MSSPNGQDATAINRDGTANAPAGGRDAAPAHNGGRANARASNKGKGKTPAQKGAPALPDLTGKYELLRPTVESQRISVGKVMADHAIAMFKVVEEIDDREESIARFSGTFADDSELGEDGQPKIKPFIPNSLRKPLPLNASKKAKHDSRCPKSRNEITALTAAARATYSAYQTAMSAHFKRQGELEIKARKEILRHQYCTALVDIAEGLVIVGKHRDDVSAPVLTTTELAHAAIHEALKELPDEHWQELPFVASDALRSTSRSKNRPAYSTRSTSNAKSTPTQAR